LALDLLSFSAVNSPGLQYFFKRHAPRIHIPDESTLRKKYLSEVYDMVADAVRAELANVDTLNLMFDGWSDKHHAMHYLGFRVQYIADDWSGKVITISVKRCGQDMRRV